MAHRRRVTERDYERLLSVRTRLRRFEHWSAERAGEHGLTGSQHQLLLAIRGHQDPAGPTIGDVADYLLVRPNTAVELVNRAQELGLVVRHQDSGDHRAVRLELTTAGTQTLQALSPAHIEELASLTTMVEGVLRDLGGS